MNEPHDLAQWSLHCFCLGAKETPHGVVREHGALLHRLIGGAPAAALSEASLALLERHNLVRRDGELVRISFPVLGTEASQLLRERARSVAAAIVTDIADPVQEVGRQLAASGFAGHTHAIVFGHVLDGLSWEVTRSLTTLPDTSLSAERPLWNGVFWASYPKPERTGGTNELRGRHGTLVMVWEDHNLAAVRAFAAAPEVLAALDRMTPGTPELTLDGVRMPVMGRGTPPRLTAAAAGIAAIVARRLVDQPDLGPELERLGIDLSAGELPVVFGHELIWAIRDLLSEDRIVPHAAPGPLATTMFIRA